MKRDEFNKETERLTEMFGEFRSPLQADEYFKAVGRNPLHIFRKAVTLLIKSHQYSRLPLPAEVEKAIKDVYVEESQPSATELGLLQATSDCVVCHGTGWELGDLFGYATVVHCECPVGQRLLKGNQRRIRKDGSFNIHFKR